MDQSLAKQSRNYKSVMFDHCWRAYSRCKSPHLWMRRAQSTWAPLGLWQGKPLSRHEGPGPASGRKIFQIQRIVIGQWLIDLTKEEMKDTLRNSSSSVEDQPGLTDLVQLISERYATHAAQAEELQWRTTYVRLLCDPIWICLNAWIQPEYFWRQMLRNLREAPLD